ncbi:hypothetical protein [Methylopila sp. 73B]|uniref:hypothetical protein n=1 Tax=Methylopila sp. 73B TaxID=1120792 RepID=UPI0003732A93|nr:hypothetical protein [Methylopila sp. 73B]
MSDPHAAPTGDLRPEALLERVFAAYDRAKYVPGDCPTVPVKVAALLDTIRAARDEALASAQPAAVAGDALREKLLRLIDYHVTDDDDRSTLRNAVSAAVPKGLALVASILSKPAMEPVVGPLLDALKSATPARTYIEADMAAAQQEIERLQSELAEMEEQRDVARSDPWPEWTTRIIATLESFGVEVVDTSIGEIADFADAFDDWFRGALANEIARAEAAEADMAAARAEEPKTCIGFVNMYGDDPDDAFVSPTICANEAAARQYADRTRLSRHLGVAMLVPCDPPPAAADVASGREGGR